MKIRNESELLTTKQIKIIEDSKNAKFVCETCVRGRDGEWINRPAAIFWCEKKHPESHSNYFAVVISTNSQFVITNGQSAADEPFVGIIAENGDIVYSRYRHDFRTSEDGTVTIDGGRDYTKVNFTDYIGDQVRLQIRNDRLVVLEHC